MEKIYENLDLENIYGELWKEISGYDGDYFISNFGRVKSFKNGKEKILKQCENRCGYLCIGLYKNGKGKPKRIHRLMFESFNNYKIRKNECIHHIDENKINNILDNFQLMARKEHNIKHNTGENHPFYGKHHSEETLKLLIEKKKGIYLGEKHPQSILTENNVIKIRLDLNNGLLTQKEIGDKFGVDKSTISKIKNNKIWKHI